MFYIETFRESNCFGPGDEWDTEIKNLTNLTTIQCWLQISGAAQLTSVPWRPQKSLKRLMVVSSLFPSRNDKKCLFPKMKQPLKTVVSSYVSTR